MLLDNQLEPWLLEVNQSPSFKTDSPLDSKVKGDLIRDTIKLLNLSYRRKSKYIQTAKKELKLRMITGKRVQLSLDEKAQNQQKREEARSKYELQNLGGYSLIYPIKEASLMDKYDVMLK